MLPFTKRASWRIIILLYFARAVLFERFPDALLHSNIELHRAGLD